MTRCLVCNDPVPESRLTKPGYAKRFCKQAHFIAFAEEMIGIVKGSEEEAQEALGKEGFFDQLGDAAAEAAKGVRNPQEMLAKFVVIVGGNVANKLYEKATTAYRKWSAEVPAPPPTSPKTPPAPPVPPGSGTKRPNPPRAKLKEPPNLEDLPAKTRRVWYCRRFYRLPEDATEEQIKAEQRSLSLKYHPDRVVGNKEKTQKAQEVLKLINSTVTKIKAVDAELGRPWRG